MVVVNVGIISVLVADEQYASKNEVAIATSFVSEHELKAQVDTAKTA
jgi:hypothetical protein